MSRLEGLKNLKRNLVSAHMLEGYGHLRNAIGKTMIELDMEISKAEIEQAGGLLAAVRGLSDAVSKEIEP